MGGESMLARYTPVALATVTMAIAVTALRGVPASAVAASRVTGAGTVQCVAVGKAAFRPRLTDASRPTRVRTRAPLTCREGTTGTAGISVVSGKLHATTTPTSATCATTDFGPANTEIRWKANSGSVVKSKFVSGPL